MSSASHFKLWFYVAVLRLLASGVRRFGSWEALFESAPFLAWYNELARAGIAGLETSEALTRWIRTIREFEAAHAVHLPLRALREAAALDDDAITLLLTIGLADEDPRFGALFDALQGETGVKRPAAGLVGAWWDSGESDVPAVTHLRRLQSLGLIQPLNPEAPRSEWTFQVPAAVWEAASGQQQPQVLASATYKAHDALRPLGDLILDPELVTSVERLVPVLEARGIDAIVLRGPRRNGRATLAGAVAHTLGRGLLTMHTVPGRDDPAWRSVGALATLLHAMPLVRCDLGPGETAEIAPLSAYDGAVALVLGRHGGISGPLAERAISLAVETPPAALRARHWAAACGGKAVSDLPAIAERFRLTSGGIRRAGERASARAALAGRTEIAAGDVQDAVRALNRQALDTLATRVSPVTDWGHLVVAPHTRVEIDELERRCRQRERLRGSVGPALAAQLTSGVKALLSGPSGAGKTWCARALAGALQMDLYRVNVAAILDKFVGESEKRLNQVFTLAEELDVILLLDEGDSWLASRPTRVASATDKYCAYETNFLLERLEIFEGILLVTTNGAERIDTAFHRRLDVVIEFVLPEAAERLAIWDVHLPAGHAIGYETLAEIATRCALTGGQIRNAVLHAASLALDSNARVGNGHVRAAVEREYRKSGAVCPLHPVGAYAHAG